MMDQFDEIREFSNCEFMIVTDIDGIPVVDTTDALAAESEETLVTMIEELDRRLEAGYEDEEDGEGGEAPEPAKEDVEGAVIGLLFGQDGLYNVVMSVIANDEAIFGYVVVGYKVDNTKAESISRVTNCDLVILARGGEEAYKPVARYFEDTKDISEQELATRVLGAGPGEVFEFKLSGKPFKGLAGRLEGLGNEAYYVTIKSLEKEYRPFREITRGLILIGVLAILVISPLSVVAARGVTRPVNHLVEEIEKVQEGEYDEQKIVVESSDEIGIMANAFKEMVRELREQRELIEFLEQSVTDRTVMDISESQPTVALSPSQVMSNTMTPSIMGDEVRRAMDGRGELPMGFLLANRYEIISILGRGGMGVVYRARDRSLDEVVAIKMLHMGSAALKDMLKQETKLARKVTHRNILRIFDLGELDEDIQFISMEFVNGTTMNDALRRSGRLPPAIGLRVIRQVCKGLAAAHAEGIIHGDIKPENIIINNRGEVKVMDFGVARLATVELRDGDMISGTPAYMAPEQIQGRPELRSDIYSVGIMIYEFFAGGTPFKGRVTEVLRQQMESEIPDLAKINPRLPAKVVEVVNKSTMKDVSQRYSTIRDVLNDLKGL